MLSISSFGFFLSMAFVVSFFFVWRLLRAWDLDEEKILDLFLLTFFGALLGARIFFIEQNFSVFGWNIGKWFLIMKYPGLSFWGAFFGGWLAMFFFAKKLKEDFWQMADLFAPGFLVSLILGNIGCLFGGCYAGVLYNGFFAINLVGTVGKRFPVQAVEALLLGLLLMQMWPLAKKFHFRGKIISLTLIFTGLFKFIASFLAVNTRADNALSLILFLLGLLIYYKAGKKNLLQDLLLLRQGVVSFLTERSSRNLVLERVKKHWYNKKIVWKLKIKNIWKFIQRRLNVKFAPKNV